MAKPFEQEEQSSLHKVIGLKKRFLAFREPVLPTYFGFAVIQDDTGEVLFHFDDRRSLVENFFWETDENLRLKAAIRARDEDAFSGQYHGSGHRFLVQPIANLPWSLIIFYEMHLLEVVNFELGVTAVGIFVLYFSVFIFGIAVIHFFVPGTHWSWCWPNSNSRYQYLRLLTLLGLIIVHYGLSIWFLEGPALLLLTVPLPLFVLGLLYVCFEPKRKFPIRVLKRGVAWFSVVLGAIVCAIGWWFGLSFEMVE